MICPDPRPKVHWMGRMARRRLLIAALIVAAFGLGVLTHAVCRPATPARIDWESSDAQVRIRLYGLQVAIEVLKLSGDDPRFDEISAQLREAVVWLGEYEQRRP